jgi:hypothetical protein
VGKRPGRGEPGPFDVANFRRRERGPAIAAAAVTKPARLYDLRSTFASNALAAGITMFALARIMGTSAKMIEQHYGTLIDTARDAIRRGSTGRGSVASTPVSRRFSRYSQARNRSRKPQHRSR